MNAREASDALDNRGFGTMRSLRRRGTIETALKWFTGRVRFRVLSVLWLLMVVLMFHYSRTTVMKHGHDPLDQMWHSSSEQLLPPPLWTRASQSYINVVGLAADLTLRAGQQEQHRWRLSDPIYDGNLWHRRMLKGSRTPSSPSNMNHQSKS